MGKEKEGSGSEDEEEGNAQVDDFYDMDNYDDEVVEPPGLTTGILYLQQIKAFIIS